MVVAATTARRTPTLGEVMPVNAAALETGATRLQASCPRLALVNSADAEVTVDGPDSQLTPHLR
jgi:hypothetical protein